MILISCNGCGLVLDQGKLIIPTLENEDGSINLDVAEWDGDRYVPTHNCPVCSNRIQLQVMT